MKIIPIISMAICASILSDSVIAGTKCGTVGTYNYLITISQSGYREDYTCQTMSGSSIGNTLQCICLTYDSMNGNSLYGCKNYQANNPATTAGCLSCQPDEYVNNWGCSKCPENALGSNNGGAHTNTSCQYCISGYEKDANGVCVKKISCSWQQFFDGTRCARCPTGSYGAYESYISHTETECSYCENNYYWNENSKRCLPCPSGGLTSSPGIYANRYASITNCYLPVGTSGSDSTGSYVIEKKSCYYTN